MSFASCWFPAKMEETIAVRTFCKLAIFTFGMTFGCLRANLPLGTCFCSSLDTGVGVSTQHQQFSIAVLTGNQTQVLATTT